MDGSLLFLLCTIGWSECSQQRRLMVERHQDTTAARHRAIVMVTKHLLVNWMKSVLVAMVTTGVK